MEFCGLGLGKMTRPKHPNYGEYAKLAAEVQRAETALESLRQTEGYCRAKIIEREVAIREKRRRLLELAARINLTLGGPTGG